MSIVDVAEAAIGCGLALVTFVVIRRATGKIALELIRRRLHGHTDRKKDR